MFKPDRVDAALEAAGVRMASKRQEFIEVLPKLVELGINNDNRLAVFIGQLSHESRGFEVLEENLNYSAKRLMQVWPSRFPSISVAKRYARNPKALANKVYNGRMGNRIGSDDGWDYRGRGPIQITGRNNYATYGYALDPGYLEYMSIGLKVSAAFFAHNNLLNMADNLGHRAITRRINGGYHGLADRKRKTMKALAALKSTKTEQPFKLIKLGSRGARVKEIQRILGLNADGIYGNMTRAAVVAYQVVNELVPDGIVGKNTYKLMMGG